MNLRKPASLLLATSVLALTGCAPSWKMVRANDAGDRVPAQGYAVTLPPGWVKLSVSNGAVLVASLDGEQLDLIRISREDNDKAFLAIKKTASPSEQPADLAEDFIAVAKASQSESSLQVLKNEPTSLGGKDGFHLIFAFTNPDGVRYQSEVYAVCTQDGFFTLIYRAPVLHYFDPHEPEFQKAVASFQLLPRSRS